LVPFLLVLKGTKVSKVLPALKVLLVLKVP
jgi:hypothetical protein